MLSKITKFIKRILMGFFILYGYNLLVPMEAIIPINLITIIITSILGLPGLIALIIIRLVIY